MTDADRENVVENNGTVLRSVVSVTNTELHNNDPWAERKMYFKKMYGDFRISDCIF